MDFNKTNTGVMLCEAPFPNVAVLFARSGLDFMVIDCEHGCFDTSVLSALLMNSRLAGMPALVRLPDNQRREVLRLMDLGAAGLVLPMTHGPDDIAEVVQHAKYAPLGRRGVSTTRAHSLYDPPPLKQYMSRTNQATMIFAQIESKAGLDAVDAILAVEGVAGVLIGPSDLAADLDCVGEKSPILEAITHVASAASRAGKPSGIITGDTAFLAQGKTSGMRLFCVGSELSILKAGCQETIARVRALEP